MHGPRLEEYYTLSAKNSPASKAYTRAFLAPTQPDGGGVEFLTPKIEPTSKKNISFADSASEVKVESPSVDRGKETELGIQDHDVIEEERRCSP